jgi:electron transfer flavoprotein beta subunit
MLAQFLNIPCVSNVIKIEVTDDSHIQVSRLGDAGTEILDVTLPAVITVSDGINEPRLPAMRGIMMAKKKKINVMDLAGLGTSFEDVGGGAPASGIVEFMPTEKRKGGQKFEGEPAEVTAKVVDLLVNEAKVL